MFIINILWKFIVHGLPLHNRKEIFYEIIIF